MDWYLKNCNDDFLVPDEQESLATICTEDGSLSPNDWCHWEASRSKKFVLPNGYCGRSKRATEDEFNFDGQNSHDQVSKKFPVRRCERSDYSTACGEQTIEHCSVQTSEVSFHGQPDFLLQNSSEQMDDIFLNSLWEEDIHSMEYPFESLHVFPDSTYKSLLFENFQTTMLPDPQNLMTESARFGSSKHMESCSVPLFAIDVSEDWEKTTNSSPSCLMKISEGSPMGPDLSVFLPDKVNMFNEDVVHVVPKCLEAAVLQELEDVMVQLSGKMRICFRDALYRLAKNSKQQQTIHQSRNSTIVSEPAVTEIKGDNPRLEGSQGMESETNVIDRTIANLMFNKTCCIPPSFPHSGSVHEKEENSAPYGSSFSLGQPS